MVHLVDAHTLVWFLNGSNKVGSSALAILRNPSKSLVIPSIVLCEVRWMIRKKRIEISLDEVFEALQEDPRCEIYPLDTHVVQRMSDTLEMHDDIICGTALVYKHLRGEEVKILTDDPAIRDSGIVETVW